MPVLELAENPLEFGLLGVDAEDLEDLWSTEHHHAEVAPPAAEPDEAGAGRVVTVLSLGTLDEVEPDLEFARGAGVVAAGGEGLHQRDPGEERTHRVER